MRVLSGNSGPTLKGGLPKKAKSTQVTPGPQETFQGNITYQLHACPGKYPRVQKAHSLWQFLGLSDAGPRSPPHQPRGCRKAHEPPSKTPMGVSAGMPHETQPLMEKKKKKFKPVGRDPCHGTRWFYMKTDRWTNAPVQGQLEDHDATANPVLTWIHPTFPEHLSQATKFTPATRVGYIFLQSPQQPAR